MTTLPVSLDHIVDEVFAVDSVNSINAADSVLVRTRVDYSSLETLDDWRLEKDKHPEWMGQSTTQIQKNKALKGNSFMQAFYRWTGRQTDDIKQRDALRQSLFPSLVPDRVSLMTIADWIAEKEKHSEWSSKSTSWMRDDRDTGGSGFLQAFYQWVSAQTDDDAQRKTLRQQLFAPKLNDWGGMKTIDDWSRFYEAHPEWDGLTATEVIEREGGAFYSKFMSWNRANTPDPAQRRACYDLLFSRKRMRYANLTTLDDWLRFRDNTHPEWKERNREEMMDGSDSNSFWCHFLKWTRHATHSHSTRQNLREAMAVRTRPDYSSLVTTRDWKERYDQNTAWHSMNVAELSRDGEYDGKGFYSSFCLWVRDQTSDDALRKTLRGKVLQYELRDWSTLDSLGDWVRMYLSTPSWHSMSSTDLGEDADSEGKFFYNSYRKFLLRNYTTTRTRTQARGVLDVNLPYFHWNAVQSLREGQILEHVVGFDSAEVRDAVTTLNVLKLAYNQCGEYIERTVYETLIREIFSDRVSLEDQIGDKAGDVLAYLHSVALGGTLSTTEEILDPTSKNPNFRISIYLGTDKNVGCDDTLDAFVKFFSREEERDTELAFTNWFVGHAAVRTVGRARGVKLSMRIERDEEPEHRDGVYTSVTVCGIEDKSGSSASYALVTPFMDVRPAAQELYGTRRKGMLDKITSAVYDFHRTSLLGMDVTCDDTFQSVAGRAERISFYAAAQGEIALPSTSLYQLLDHIGVMSDLDQYASENSVLIHGDCHTKNILLDEDNEVVFADLERTRLGIPQQDITKYLGARSTKLSCEEQERQLDLYLQLSGVQEAGEVHEFKRIYDVMTVYEELRVCRHIVDRPSTFKSQTDWDESFQYHLNRALDHARNVYSAEQVVALERTVRETFSTL